MTENRVLVSHAQVVTCSGDLTERPFDGDVLVEGDRIAGVFHGRAPVAAGSVREIDAAGATVIPGLCDAHTHISWPVGFLFNHAEIAAMPSDEHVLEAANVVRTFLRCGYTLLIGAGTLKPRSDVLLSRAIERGLLEGPRLIPSGEHLTPRGGVGEGFSCEVDSVEHLRSLVRAQCEMGVKSIKMMLSGDGLAGPDAYPSTITYFDDEMVSAAVKEAEAHGAFITAHARSAESIRMAVRNGVRIVHHASFVDDEGISELSAARDRVWVCPGLHYLRMVNEGKAAPYGIKQELVEDALYPEDLQSSIDGLRKLHSNGVRIVAGGDFGHQWTPHGTYASELVAYVELLGFSPLEALIAATANAGPIIDDKLGQIREGYFADLVLVDGDPTTNVRVLLDPDKVGPVIKGGTPVPMPGWGGVEQWAASRRA